MKKEHILLWLLFFISIFLRLWQLDAVPPGVHTDEADTGYSAYSILKTGLDPHGSFSFFALADSNIGGVHPPVYTFVLIPLVNFFGLNIFVERLPSAITGVLTIPIIYFLAKRLFKSNSIVFLVTVLSVFNPWMIHISRQGLLEAMSLFFVLGGILALFMSKEKKGYLLVAALLFGISLYTYDAPKIFIPPFILLFLFYEKSFFWRNKKWTATFLAFFAVFYMSIIYQTVFMGEIEDFNRSSIFGSIPENVNSERSLTKAPLWASSIFHNKFTVALKRFETSYVSIFSINWFFVNGSNNLQHSPGNHGQFYLFSLPFFFIGIHALFRKDKKVGLFLLAWMIIGALPGGLTTGNYAYRSIHILPVPILFTSYGVYEFMIWTQKQKRHNRLFMRGGLYIIMVVYISSYLFGYFYDYPVYASESWNKQQNDAVIHALHSKNKFDNIYIDGHEPWAILYAYFNKTEPSFYQQAYKNQGFFHGVKIITLDNIHFGHFPIDKIQHPSDYFPRNSLVITNGARFEEVPAEKIFYDPGGIRPIFKAFSTK